MEIFCWNGDWGLPSIDIGCLHVSAFAKFAEVPVTIKPSKVPFVKYSVKQFPILKKDDGQYVCGEEDILKYFGSIQCQPDLGVLPEQYADVVAFKALVMHKLHPCVAYYLWLDSRNFAEFSRPAYAKACVFPLNFVIPGRYYKSALRYINGTTTHVNMTLDELGEELHLEAQDCINLLSNYLGDKEFFFGNRPTSFDALIFAYLAPLVKAKFANTKLQNYVNACENLVKYVSRILSRYFQKEVEGKTDTSKEKEKHESEHDWIMPVAGASIVMLMYAAHIGLLLSKS
eukprot:gene10097-11128_t